MSDARDEKPRVSMFFATTDAGLVSAGASMRRLSYLARASSHFWILEGSTLILCTEMHSPGMAFDPMLLMQFATAMPMSDGLVNASAAFLKHRSTGSKYSAYALHA